MFSVLGPRGRLCDSLSRRELLSIGGLSLLGWGLPQFLRQQAAAAERPRHWQASCGQQLQEPVLVISDVRHSRHVRCPVLAQYEDAAKAASSLRLNPRDLGGHSTRHRPCAHQPQVGSEFAQELVDLLATNKRLFVHLLSYGFGLVTCCQLVPFHFSMRVMGR
jgi:hypothetical protein